MDSNNPIGAPLNELYEKFAREVERREGRHTVSVQELEVPLRGVLYIMLAIVSGV